MVIAIGGDHASPDLKQAIMTKFGADGIVFKNFGTNDHASVDYPDFGHPVAKSALCWTTELATLARQHNDANILALPARFVSTDQALEIVAAFLSASFEGGRHQNRVNKINC